MRKKEEMSDPFGRVVDVDVAIKRWRNVASVIRRELGFGPMYGFDPGMSFHTIDGSGTINLTKSVYIPLYHMCVEVRRLRRRAKCGRSRELQKILDDGKARVRNQKNEAESLWRRFGLWSKI